MVTEGFIDGDLVEKFLDLPEAQMSEVVKGIKVCVVSLLMGLGCGIINCVV